MAQGNTCVAGSNTRFVREEGETHADFSLHFLHPRTGNAALQGFYHLGVAGHNNITGLRYGTGAPTNAATCGRLVSAGSTLRC